MKFIGEDTSWNGIKTRFYYDAANKKIHQYRVQDVQPQLEQNVQQYNKHTDHKASRYKSPMHKVATIPPGLVEQWMKEGFNIFTCTDAELRRKLDDPAYRKLRTMPGRLRK